MQNCVEPVGEIGARRNLVWNARVADLRLGADDPLRNRGWRREKGACDLLGRQAADGAQRQGNLRVGRERRVATGEDQPQAIVAYAFVVALPLG